MTPAERKLVFRRNAFLKKKGITISDFAQSIGWAYNSAYRIFAGPRKPRELYADRILAVYRNFPIR